MGDTVPHITQTEVRVHGDIVFVDGQRYMRGHASGARNNCLIDTLRQQLGLTVDCSVVRRGLQARFRDGEAKVDAANFLELRHHWRDVIDLLFQADVSGKLKIDSSRFRITCVDLDFAGNGEVVQGDVGEPLHPLCIARENQNHFIPLFRHGE